LAALTPMIFNTTEAAILCLTPEERGCYAENQFKLKIISEADGFQYSLRNCFYSALLEKIALNCSCTSQIYGTVSGYGHLYPCRY
jgi:hypothetical protein